MPVEGEHYWRDKDGLWVENVGPWAKEKLKILTDYALPHAFWRKITSLAKSPELDL
jgi:hypothetical protein